MNRRQFLTSTTAFALLLATPAARATQLVGLDVPALTRASDAIVVGKVTRVQSRWTRDNLRIVTEIDISISETIKADPKANPTAAATVQQTVTVLQPGGVVGELGQVVSGLARFELGDEVVVFLERQGLRYAVTGMAQGKFRVERSTDGKASFAVPEDISDAVLVDPLTRQPMPSPLRPTELGELKRQIRVALRTVRETP